MSETEKPGRLPAAATSSSGGIDAPGADRPANRQRRYQRAHVEMVVQLRFGNVQQFLDATAEDLSVGGMFLRSEHAGPGGKLREIGQMISLQFDAGAHRVVEGVGRVVRVVTPDAPGVIPGVGVEFVELNERSRELIEAIVAIKLAPTGSS